MSLLTISSSSDEELSEIDSSASDSSVRGRVDICDYEDDDDESGPQIGIGNVRTKNEVNAETGPIDLNNITVPDNAPLEKLGVVERLIDWTAIVKAHTDGEYRVLDEGGLVVNESRQLIGTVRSSCNRR